MLRLAEILLRGLDFGDDGRLLHPAKQRVKRFARLKINRAVLYLNDHIGAELPVQFRELNVGALGTIRVNIVVINKRAPHDVAFVRRERVGQNICAVGVSAAIGFWSGLTFGVRLDEKPAEVGNESVNFIGLRLPPIGHALVQRIGRCQPACAHRRGEVGAEIHSHAVRPPYIGERGDFAQIVRRQNVRVGIDVIDDRAVDSEGGAGTRIIRVARAEFSRQIIPLPHRAPGVTTFDCSVGIVPMIHQPKLKRGTFCDVEFLNQLARLHQPQEMKSTIQRADFGVGGNHHHRFISDARRTNDETFDSDNAQIRCPIQIANQR